MNSLRSLRLGACLTLLALPAAGNVQVTTTIDENNGTLDPATGAGTSLREAVLFALEGSVIDFAPALNAQTLTVTSGQISFGKSLTLDASALASGITVSGNNSSRVFDIPSSRTVAITRLKIVHGSNSGDGGGLRNAGTLTLTGCELSENQAGDGGGAIENSGTLSLTGCTLWGNTADVGGGSIEHAAGTLTATNCTFTGNTANVGGALDGDGSSTIRLYSCTVSGNHANDDGGGLEETTGTLLLENSIVAGNTASDVGSDLKATSINTQSGVNLVSSTAGLGGGFSGIIAPPQLSSLGDFGGPTRTMPPLADSPAINAGGSTTLLVDQRGLPRVVGTKVDIGAVELQTVSPPDTWETLASPPFPYGTSAGGGLTTDGTYLYAADLSGDAEFDFIDVNDNGTRDAGEGLAERDIANASVRIARFDPVAGTWQSLPTIPSGGFSGDSFSHQNFNGPLFRAAGFLYYYQLRSGPATCVLHRYDLSTAPGGAWSIVWEKSYAQALLEPSAGMTGVDTPDGPVILHHRGGGSRDFCRTSALGSGGQHVQLTPNWPNDPANFPRNGSWDYDAHRGNLYHLSGDQLLAWSPSASYPDSSFLTTVPAAGDPLAIYSTPIASLKSTLGWDPGGTASHPGASVWGNSITVVNAPSLVTGGPDGEDTGANVVYLVRGETTPDEWPFNEGRGRVNNGSFARWFPATGHAQTLNPAPFLVGKGSDSVYLGGFLYLTQGDTRNSPDAAGNDAPTNADGIRKPGNGFARFRIREGDYTTGPPVIPVADLQRDGFTTVTASPHLAGDPANLFDRDWDSSMITASVNPAVVTVTFTDATPVGAARAAFGSDAHQWTLDAANSTADLAAESGSFLRIFGPAAVSGDGPHWQQWNATPVSRRIFRFTIQRVGGASVEIRELELQRPKEIRIVDVGGLPVEVNHLELVPDAPVVILGQTLEMTAELSLSLGPDRHDVTSAASWSSSTPAVATVNAVGEVDALNVGETTLTASFEGFTAQTVLTVVDPQPHDNDMSVGWIQRLPVIDYVWNSPHPETAGWPTVGSSVTWRARVRNWWPFPRHNVAFRWRLDGVTVDTGIAHLAADGYTNIDFPWPWTFDCHVLRFELDPQNAIGEFSEQNNTLQTWTDAITAGFWIEQSFYDYMHANQKGLGIGSNGFEDWAQRQVGRWNQAYAASTHPYDSPQGVLGRVRLDKITVVPDGTLPISGGRPSNNPDNSDRTVDLVWGFHSWDWPAGQVPPILTGYMTDPAFHDTSKIFQVVDSNPFYYDGVLFHETSHARYLVDLGFNVQSGYDSGSDVAIKVGGQLVVGTPYMPRAGPPWDHVFYADGKKPGSPFHGLMSTDYSKVDRYSVMALNRITGHRAVAGNYNAPENLGVFLTGSTPDLPDQNTVQVSDGHGNLLGGATVHLYRATPGTFSDRGYPKQFDDTIDATFIADASGNIELGSNPFTTGGPIQHGPGGSTCVLILRVESGGKTGFGFLPAGLFNMEYWRGHASHGRHELSVAMIGPDPEIAQALAWTEEGNRKLRITLGGPAQPGGIAVSVDGHAGSYQEGAWWVSFPDGTSSTSQVTATWPGGPTLTETVFLDPPAIAPQLFPEKIPGGLRVSWWSRAGYRYRVEHSANLTTWAPGFELFGTGDWMLQDDPGTDARGFTRLQAERLTD